MIFNNLSTKYLNKGDRPQTEVKYGVRPRLKLIHVKRTLRIDI
jgi:hypothetical protein